MVDFAKKIRKHRSQDLHPGEEVLAATFVQPVGSFGRQLGTQLGGVVGAVASARADKKRAAEAAESEPDDLPADGGLAARITVSPAVIGISAQRVLVFGHSKLSGRPQELDVAFPLPDIAGITTEKKKMSSTLDIRFTDGSVAQFEVVRPAKPGPLLEAFEQHRS